MSNHLPYTPNGSPSMFQDPSQKALVQPLGYPARSAMSLALPQSW
jgi:hypothetical protein